MTAIPLPSQSLFLAHFTNSGKSYELMRTGLNNVVPNGKFQSTTCADRVEQVTLADVMQPLINVSSFGHNLGFGHGQNVESTPLCRRSSSTDNVQVICLENHCYTLNFVIEGIIRLYPQFCY
jgi:hypothetical protein